MMKEYRGIDLSRHNHVTSFKDIARSVDFVILRAGGNFGGYYADSRFEQYYEGCKKYNIPVGAYYDAGKEFTDALTGQKYALHFLKLLAGKKFEFPVYLDIEVTPRVYKKGITQAAISFCRELEDFGYFAGIYASDISGFKELLDITQVAQFSFWVARYGNKPSYVRRYGMWQYSSRGNIPGIIGNVDLDIAYQNFPKIIKGAKLNGYN